MQKKQAQNDSVDNINYIYASIYDDRFKVETYDVILAFNVLHYIEDMPRLVDRINTLLKPNGVFVSSTACLKEKRSLVGYLVLLLAKTGMMPRIFFYDKNELETLVTEENFEMIKSEIISKLPEYFIVSKKRK